MKQKIIMFIAWHLPPSVLMWAFIRAMSLGWEKTNKTPDKVTYTDVYKTLKEKYKLKDF